MQVLPTPSSIDSINQFDDTTPADQPQVSWKRWAVRIITTITSIVSATFALSAILAGFITTAAVFGTITVVSTACAIIAFSQNSSPPPASSHGVGKQSESLTSHTNTSEIVHSQGYEIVDVPGDGNCFFHAAAVQCPSWDAHTLRQRVHKEASQWLCEYEKRRIPWPETFDGWDPYERLRFISENALYAYLTDRFDHHGITGQDAIKRNGEWMHSQIVPLVASALKKPVIAVRDSGTILNAADNRGMYLPIADHHLENLDLNALGDFVLLEHINNNHFRGCRKRNVCHSLKIGG